MCSVLALSACTPTQATRGNIVEDHRMEAIIAGESSRTDVLRNMGSPTTQAPFDDNIWYYIGQKTEKHGIFDPEVVEEKIVVVAFNDEGIVQDVQEVDSDRVDIPVVRRKTPTGGHEVTLMQQLLGNVGRFNAPTNEGPGR
ncbi:MAG: outer membrane protein assembly factor BamE [Pseudomonadota bacterium]